MAPLHGKYGIHDRVAAIESEVNGIRVDLDNKHLKPGPTGPGGPQGVKGDSIVGPAGRDGRDGKDSTVPGPVSTTPGPAGPRGIGERGPAGPDTAKAISDVRDEMYVLRTEQVRQAAVLQGLLDYNTHAASYIEWLRSKRRT